MNVLPQYIQRLFSRDGLDPESRFCGNGGAVDVNAINEHLRQFHRGAESRAQGAPSTLGERLQGPLDRFGGGER